MQTPSGPRLDTTALAGWRKPLDRMRDDWQQFALSRRGRTLGALFALTFGALMLSPGAAPFPDLRNLAFDTYQTWLPRQRAAQPAVIIAVDDRSLARVGQWPWPRDTMARLLDRIAARKPAVIGIDILFAEPDRTSPDRIAGQFDRRDPALAAGLRRWPSHDASFADALARVPVVLAVIGTEKSVKGAGKGDVSGFPPARMIGPPPRLQAFAGSQRSLPQIDAAARGRGLVNAELDDGVVRSVPLVATIAGYPLLSFPLECLRVAANEPVFSVLSDRSAPFRVAIGDLVVPAQADGRLFVHYAGHQPARYLSAVDVLEGRDAPDQIAGRVALLGVTGQGLVDYQLTPNGERLPGVEVHAEVIEDVFDGSLLYRSAAAPGIEALCFGLLALLALAWVPRLSPLRSTLLYLGSAGLLLGGGVGAYAWQRQLLDPLTPLAGLSLLHLMLALVAWMAIERERRRLATNLAIEREAAARTAGELEAARRIQTGMLPRPERVLANETRAALFAHMHPAREVGGDLFDFFYLDQRRLFAVVGDVAGKGLAAALFMAVSKALTKSSSLRATGNLGQLLENINIELARDNPDELFVTLLAVVLDLDSGRLEYCNAGHEPLMLVRADGQVQVLDQGGGPPLCVFDYIGYDSASVALQPGDALALVSDGITEAMSPDGSLFGRVALSAVLRDASRAGGDVQDMGNQVLGQVAVFEAGVDPADDQTLLVLRWVGPAGEANRPGG